ncbi:MAG: RCC1 domain-containing protein, partial [Oscillospiraceae bacterium]
PMYVDGFDGGAGSHYAVSLAAGAGHALALTADGQVYTWGDGADGRLGQGKNTNQDTYSLTPVLVYQTEVKPVTVEGKTVYTADFKLDAGNKIPFLAQSIAIGGAHSVLGSVEQTTTDSTAPDGIAVIPGVGKVQMLDSNKTPLYYKTGPDGTHLGGYTTEETYLNANGIATSADKVMVPVDDNGKYGVLYAYGDNSKGQIGVGKSAQPVNETYIPRMVLGETVGMKPVNIVLPIGGTQVLLPTAEKFYPANGNDAPMIDYQWDIVSQIDENGNAVTPDNTIGSVTDQKPDPNHHKYVLTAHKLGSATIRMTDKQSGYQVTTSLEVVTRDAVRAAKIFAGEKSPDY